MNGRPFAATVIACVAIVYGSAWAFCGTVTVALLAIGWATATRYLPPPADVPSVPPEFEPFVAIATSVAALGFLAAFGGVGLLLLRAWGRYCSELACWVAIAFIAVLTFVLMKYTAPQVMFLVVVVVLATLVQAPCVVAVWFLRGPELRRAIATRTRRARTSRG